ncbi:hypothetical protein P7K49_014707 [Saguinus oedipus]|uniref:Uncharacterized protein n=1 Tax=Saguinus oedipus TaxID=9490 RepID=A0ABQ9V758_SAGOE|nr:hypothetical protein P7K49_014707 [Saguinus oedipus]
MALPQISDNSGSEPLLVTLPLPSSRVSALKAPGTGFSCCWEPTHDPGADSVKRLLSLSPGPGSRAPEELQNVVSGFAIATSVSVQGISSALLL